MTPDISEALKYNPFDGDFGEVGDRELRDRIVTFRKGGRCQICGDEVVPGTRGRSLTMLWMSDGIMSYRYCTECTAAMAAVWTDDGKALDRRYAKRSKPRA